jgi:hypothetical protein
MAHGSHEHHGHHAKELPADLSAPAFVSGWQKRALTVGVVFTILGAVLAVLAATANHDGINHLLRSYLMGFMLCLGLTLGGMAFLMVQYLSGGKWGLLLRRPLEAMSRTLPLAFLMFIPIGLFFKKLYLWAAVSNVGDALRSGFINREQAHAIAWKRPMLSIPSVWIQVLVCFAIWFGFVYILNKWGLQRDADPEHRYSYWQKRFENVSGVGVVLYALTLTVVSIDLVMSLNITWFSTMYGLLFLVGQGYSVLALAVITVIRLSDGEPYKTILRKTEQHDLGKLCFAFTMLNIYLAFAQFLIIWSGNQPEEIPWYLDRIRGGWGEIATLDFIFHWVIPFSLLLSRDLKRDKERLVLVCKWMLFARCWDMWWLIEPNFPDAARHLRWSFGQFEYFTIPVAMIAFWLAFYFTQLKKRALVPVNDPHLAEILEPEHAHA